MPDSYSSCINTWQSLIQCVTGPHTSHDQKQISISLKFHPDHNCYTTSSNVLFYFMSHATTPSLIPTLKTSECTLHIIFSYLK